MRFELFCSLACYLVFHGGALNQTNLLGGCASLTGSGTSNRHACLCMWATNTHTYTHTQTQSGLREGEKEIERLIAGVKVFRCCAGFCHIAILDSQSPL